MKMKKLIEKLKEIETIVELNVGKELTESAATDIYALTNELMVELKKIHVFHVGHRNLYSELRAIGLTHDAVDQVLDWSNTLHQPVEMVKKVAGGYMVPSMGEYNPSNKKDMKDENLQFGQTVWVRNSEDQPWKKAKFIVYDNVNQETPFKYEAIMEGGFAEWYRFLTTTDPYAEPNWYLLAVERMKKTTELYDPEMLANAAVEVYKEWLDNKKQQLASDGDLVGVSERRPYEPKQLKKTNRKLPPRSSNPYDCGGR
jgi:hypothetical protein